MNPKILHNIPAQKYEQVRDVIGSILKIELDHQAKTYPTPGDYNVIPSGINFYTGMLSAMDKTDCPLVIVNMQDGKFDGKDGTTRDGSYVFSVDVYCNPDGDEENGCVQRDALVGAIRYILDHPDYNNLGFEPGFISGTRVESIQSMDQRSSQEADKIAISRLLFSADLVEDNVLTQPQPLHEALCTVKLDKTDKGYRYAYINPE